MPSFIETISDFNMTLSYFILNGFQLHPDYYGCPVNSASVPEHRRPYWGALYFSIGIIIMIFYTPCLIAIAKNEQMKTPAYKVMIFIGIFDMSSTFIHSFVTGFLGFHGISFCDYPRLFYVFGSIGMTSWMGCCISSIVLALIRIGDLNFQIKLRMCFKGWRIYFVLCMFLVYISYPLFLAKPIIFNPVYMSWFFDPGVGKDPSLYVNVFHTFNNTMTAVGTILFYGYLALVIIKESKACSTKELRRIQISILLQSFLFCIFHAIGAAIYSYMQFFHSSETIIIIGHISWQFSSGAVCIVYLTLNKTIRNSVLQLFWDQHDSKEIVTF